MNAQKLPPVYFLHIPKTAGSSLSQLILCAYPEGYQLNCSLSQLLQMSREEINQFQCFSGHWGTGLFSLLNKNISSVTMLRDPFERTISGIKFAKKIYNHPILMQTPEVLKIYDKGDFREIVNHPFVSKTMQETQNLYLGYDIDLNIYHVDQTSVDKSRRNIFYLEEFFARELSSGLIDMNEIFIKAKQRLDAMEVVGIAEQFNDSARLICDFLGIRTPKTIPQERVSPEKLALGNLTYRESGMIPDDVIKRIDELTLCDQELYEYGKTLFNKQLLRKKKKFFWFLPA